MVSNKYFSMIAVLFTAFSAVVVLLVSSPCFAEDILVPTPEEVKSWGFTWKEFQNLSNYYERKLSQYYNLLNKKNKNDPNIIRPSDQKLHNWAQGDTGRELWLRRRGTTTQDNFTQSGMKDRMLRAAKTDLQSERSLLKTIRDLKRHLQRIEDARAPTVRVQDGQSSSGGRTRIHEEGSMPSPLDGDGAAGSSSSASASGGLRSPPPDAPEWNPNYTGPPDMDDPNLRGDWKPIKPGTTPRVKPSGGATSSSGTKPPPRWGPNYQGPPDGSRPAAQGNWQPYKPPQPTFAEQYGPQTILIAANVEIIARCKSQNIPADQCLKQIMVANGIAATVAVAAQLLAAHPVALTVLGGGGAILAIWKGGSDLYEYLDEWNQACNAIEEADRLEEDREDWTKFNLEFRDLDADIEKLRSRITSTMEPLVSTIVSGCQQLEKMAWEAAQKGKEAEQTLATLPSTEILAKFGNLDDKADRALEIQKNLEALRDRMQGWLQNLNKGIGWADAASRNCKSKNTARAIAEKHKNALAVLKGIQQRAAEAEGMAAELTALEGELNQARTTVNEAFGRKDKLSTLSDGITPFAQFEAIMESVRSAEKNRHQKAKNLSSEVTNLRHAYMEAIDSKTEYRIYALKQLIVSYEFEKPCCDPDQYHGQYNEGAGKAVLLKLEAENRLRSMETFNSILSRIIPGSGSGNVEAIVAIEQEAVALMFVNSDLPQRARECEEHAADDNDDNPFAGGDKNNPLDLWQDRENERIASLNDQNLADSSAANTLENNGFSLDDLEEDIEENFEAVSSPPERCSRDDDCPYGYHCRNRTCVPDRCSKNADCPYGFVCRNSRCIEIRPDETPESCSKNSDCPEGQVCRNSRCEPLRADTVPESCSKNADCPEGYACRNSRCEKLRPDQVPEQCQKNADCPQGYICRDSTCVKIRPDEVPSRCGKNSDCPEGYAFRDSRCVKLRPDQVPDQCQKNADCPQGYVCRDSTCVKIRPDEVPSRCGKNADCPEGYKCRDSKCVKIRPDPEAPTHCSRDTDCPKGFVCWHRNCEKFDCHIHGCRNGYKCDKKTGKCVKKKPDGTGGKEPSQGKFPKKYSGTILITFPGCSSSQPITVSLEDHTVGPKNLSIYKYNLVATYGFSVIHYIEKGIVRLKETKPTPHYGYHRSDGTIRIGTLGTRGHCTYTDDKLDGEISKKFGDCTVKYQFSLKRQ